MSPKKKIIYISQVDLTLNYSGTVHVKEVVEGMLNKGAEVWLTGQRTGDFQSDALSFHKLEIGRIKGSFIDYFLYQIKLFYHALNVIFKYKIDIMYVRNEAAMFAHILLKFITGIPYIVEFNSCPFRDVSNVRKVNMIQRVMVNTSLYIGIRLSQSVICVTDRLSRNIAQRYKVGAKVVTIENGANTSLFRPMSKRKCREKFGYSQDAFILCYVAYFQYYNDIEMIVEACSQLQRKIKGLTLLLVGPWAQSIRRESIERLISSKDIKNVYVVGEVDYDSIPYYINAADLCLANFNADVGDGSVMKVYEYLSCSRPAIGTSISSLEFLESSVSGVNVPIGDRAEFIKVVEGLAQDNEQLNRMGEKGKMLVHENHSWEKAVHKIWGVMGFLNKV